jgi:hypothetical protein
VFDPLLHEISEGGARARVRRALGRSRHLILQGSLDDIGLDALFEAVARRGHEARVVLHNREHRAIVVVDGRRFLYARVDGEAGDERAFERVRGWVDVRFELWVRLGRGTPAASDALPYGAPPSSRPSPTTPSSPGAAPEGECAADVALACAVLNAATAFALASLPPGRVALALARSHAEASAQHPGLGGFVITREGRVTADSVSRASVGLLRGLACWLDLVLADCERAAPGRFAAVGLDDLLGGLLNMVRHAGWHATLLAARRAPRQSAGMPHPG